MKRLLAILCFLLYVVNTFGQDSCELFFQFFNKQYGPSTELFKGTKYSPINNVQFGSPFFNNSAFDSSSLVLKNAQTYDELTLKYDIYQDELILVTTDNYGAELNIMLNKQEVQGFKIGEKTFIQKTLLHNTGFFETIYTGNITAFFKYSTNYKFSDTPENKGYGFTSTNRKLAVCNASDTLIINNNLGLYKLIDKKNRRALFKWLHQNNFKTNNATPAKFESLFIFIEQLNQNHEK